MEIVKTIADARARVAAARREGKRVGLVPTMGAFHEGHLSLVRKAREDPGFVVVSLFVNPTQFGPQEDLAKYPRDLKGDAALAERAGADLLFAPETPEMCDPDERTWVTVEGLSRILCGASRPAHFRGVTTVVLKLLAIVQPDVAYFGQKDFQQSVIVRKMARDLRLPVEIEVLPIVREKDGLAMSSRNAYLKPEERARAPAVYRSLQAAGERIRTGERDAAKVLAVIREDLEKVEGLRIDYAVAVDPETLEEKPRLKGVTAVAVAVYLGPTRLIDNMLVVC